MTCSYYQVDMIDWWLAEGNEIVDYPFGSKEQADKAILSAARKRWPELDNPRILNCHSDELLCHVDKQDGYEIEHVKLEQVGKWKLGYGVESQVLAVGTVGVSDE